MQFSEIHYAPWIIQVGIWGCICYLGHKNKLFTRYPLVFAYVGASAFFGCLNLYVASVMGASSTTYAYLYAISELLCSGLTISILLSLYWLFDRFRWDRDWHLLAVPLALLLAEASVSRGGWIFYRLNYVVYVTMNYYGACALLRHLFSRRVVLGWNLTTVLLAFTVPGAFYALSHAEFLFGGDPWARMIWMKVTALSSSAIMAVGMTEYSPPRLVEAPQLEFRTARMLMRASLKLLWRLLRS